MKLSSLIKSIFFVFLFSLIVIIIYAPSIDAPFVFDDISNIVDNPEIRLDEINYLNLKKAAFFGRSRPVARLTFAFNYYIHQYSVVGYHIVNILIHILNGIFLFYLFKYTQILSDRKQVYRSATVKVSGAHFSFQEIIAFFAVLLWITNPLHTESVTYTVQRMNSLATMFSILSLLFFVTGRRTQIRSSLDAKSFIEKDPDVSIRPYPFDPARKIFKYRMYFIASIISLIMGMGCKEITAIMPLMIILYEWFFFQDLGTTWIKRQLSFLTIMIIIVVGIAFLIIGPDPFARFSSIKDFANNEFTYTERILTQPRVVLYYIQLLLFPHPSRLNIDHEYDLSQTIFDPPSTLFSLIIICCLLSFAFYIRKKNKILSFSIFWYFATLIIESSIIPLAIIFEHRTYLPSTFFFLSIVYLLFKMISKNSIIIGSLILFIGISGLWTFQRNLVWGDDEALWRDCVEKSPSKARANNNLGIVLLSKGKIDEAINYLSLAIKINPEFAIAHNSLAVAFQERHQYDIAIEHYKEALQIKSNFIEAYNNYGVLLKKLRRYDEAITTFKKAIEIKPNSINAYINMGLTYQKQKNLTAATESYLKALKVDPGCCKCLNNLGLSLLGQGNANAAINYFEQALQINPNFSEAYVNLGLSANKLGNDTEAIDYYKVALKISPNLAEAHYNMGNIFDRNGRLNRAKTHYLEALRIDPDYTEAANNLALIYDAQNRGTEAEKLFKQAVENNPEFVEAYNNLGLLLMKCKKYDEATLYLSKALNVSPNSAEVHNNLAAVFLKTGKTELAIQHLRQSLKIKPGYTNAQKNLESAFDIQKGYAEIEKKLMDSLSKSPYNPSLHFKLGRLYESQAKYYDAISCYQKTLSVHPENLQAMNRLGTLYAIRNDYEKAIASFERILEIRPNLSNIYYNIACIYSKQNNTEKAIKYLETAIRRGYSNIDKIMTDKDLEGIKKLDGFKNLINQINEPLALP